MRKGNTSRREYWFLVVAGTGLMLLTGAGAFWLKSNADRSQLTLEMAINEEPTAPIHGFAWNNAVGDLLRSLPPDLAIEVCANLSDGAERPAPQPCAELREIVAIAPAASGVMAAAAHERPSTTTISQLPAEVAASHAMAALPQPSPIRTPIAGVGAESDTVVPAAPAPMSNEPAAVGAQIASAQTTETARLPQANEEHTPAAAIVDDPALAPWLLSTDDPRQKANETGGPGGKPRSEQAAAEAAAAAAKAQAQARARAAAEAKAKAEAEAKAKAAARAKAREKALASLRGSKDDSASGNSKADGKGKDGSSGEGGRD